MHVRWWISANVCLLVLTSVASVPALAQDSTRGDGVWADWEHRASEIQAEQPHWMTPIFTTTPRLEQEFRFDFVSRMAPSGHEAEFYTNGKGLELIPMSPVELIVGVPSYVVHNNPSDPNGWGDWPLLLKYRILANNESHGNDILSAFLGASIPTGGKANGSRTVVLSPTIAPGKGWGHFDVQSTIAVNIPTQFTQTLGHPLVYNVSFQYYLEKYFWPDVEVNGETWRDGSNIGKNQVFISPGIVFGRFRIHDRTSFVIGGGVQIATTTYRQYNHAYTVSVRMPF